MVLRRRKFRRYGSSELGVPPLKAQANYKNVYPSFPPEAGSFNHDESLRTATSYSTYDYQVYTNSRFDNPDFYRRAMVQGVDLFRKSSTRISKWLKKGPDDKEYEEQKKYLHDEEDIYSYTQDETMWDMFPFIYSFYNIFYEILSLFRSFFYFVRQEQVNAAIFTYYYFYWYFFFSEYVLEHLFLYFPLLRIFFSIQLWANLDQTYFSFYELWLGCYLPFTIIFFFSQYYLFKNFFHQANYILVGTSVFSFITFLIPVYYATGYSNILIFFVTVLLFSIFSIFYIFEFKGYFYPFSKEPSLNNYFLPAPPSNEIVYLPIFYYHFSSWPVKASKKSLSPSGNRKFFTRFPFTQNIDSVLAHKKRKLKNTLNYFRYKQILNLSMFPASIPITGLIFPKSINLNSYDFSAHIKHINTYPRPDYDYNEREVEPELWEDATDDVKLQIREFMNYFDGRSQVSFLDFISKNRSSFNFSSQSTFKYQSQNFYQPLPSQAFVSYMYPYINLSLWLQTLNPHVNYSKNDSNFNLVKINLVSFELDKTINTSPEHISSWFVSFVDSFYLRIERFLNYLTFYRGYKFKKPITTVDLALELELIIKVLTERRFISFYFYYRLIFFLARSLRQFFLTFKYVKFNPSIPYIFTYTVLLQQFEDLYLILSEHESFNSNYPATRRCIGFCCNLLFRKIITKLLI